MPVERISTPYSYSAAVAAGDFVYLGLHRGGGQTFSQQFEGTFSGLLDTAQKFGLKLEHMIKVNVWLRNISDLPKMEKMFNNYFGPGCFPARMTATTEFIDDDCLLMIDGVLYRGT